MSLLTIRRVHDSLFPYRRFFYPIAIAKKLHGNESRHGSPVSATGIDRGAPKLLEHILDFLTNYSRLPRLPITHNIFYRKRKQGDDLAVGRTTSKCSYRTPRLLISVIFLPTLRQGFV